MTIIKYSFLFFLSVAGLSLSNGCATLPNVSQMIDEASTTQEPRQIVSSKGLLSPTKSRAMSVHLTNAYFIPDDQILDAFTDAARRGVDVKIILPSTSDSRLALYAARYNYSELLKAGVKLYERHNALLHAKTAVIDGIWSTVGSTNIDFWSLLSDDEVNAVILIREFAVVVTLIIAAHVNRQHGPRID